MPHADETIRAILSQVRIGLDVFSDPEIAVLENHGYLMAEIVLSRHLPDLGRPNAPPPAVPHPDWMEEEQVASALAGSAATRLFSRRIATVGRRR